MNTLHPINILLVDDSEDDVDLTLLAFKQAKLKNQISVARNGEDAIAYLSTPSNPIPNLILLDWKMPRMNGLELLKILKDSPKWRQIPVCILTTSGNPVDVRDAYHNYANAYLEKPVQFDSLVDLVQKSNSFWFEIVTLG
ncbi:MAG: response regulator [Chamaesiphon sp.]